MLEWLNSDGSGVCFYNGSSHAGSVSHDKRQRGGLTSLLQRVCGQLCARTRTGDEETKLAALFSLEQVKVGRTSASENIIFAERHPLLKTALSERATN